MVREQPDIIKKETVAREIETNLRDTPCNNEKGRNGMEESRNKPSASSQAIDVGGKSSEMHRGARREKPSYLPSLGQTGGLDDPRRRGLSDAVVRWYLRFLEQGKSPDAARKLAEETKRPIEDVPPLAPGGKSGLESLTPQEEQAKIRKTAERRNMGMHLIPSTSKTEPGTSYTTAAKIVKVAVLSREYPSIMLTQQELTQLEKATIDEVAKGWDNIIQFEGIHLRPGMVLVDCADEETAEWLIKRVSVLGTWSGPELMARKGDDIPKSCVITVFVPRSGGQA
ncbi:uncharacterized protein LOC129614169 [Condylostylus longicornis]|uniref:uncharacterized protein LOC129614169 n=1 Tax=Condylostylus longicornis TaxID=2530218 RepID=UPI00244E2053|nr:uncharacterized protein LOC129614169 [Condylostylus longicornis]